jgi:hypothetical protein
VRKVSFSRDEEERAGTFGRKISELRPDVVIDVIRFTEPSARHLVEALRGQHRQGAAETGLSAALWIDRSGVRAGAVAD